MLQRKIERKHRGPSINNLSRCDKKDVAYFKRNGTEHVKGKAGHLKIFISL